MKNNKAKKYFDYTFLTAGTMVLIVLSVMVAMNFSKDARLFAKASIEDTSNKPTKLPVTEDEAQPSDDYGTIKFEKSEYGTTDKEGSSEKKAYKIKVEVINRSGKEGVEEMVKSTLESSGFEVTLKKDDKKQKTEEKVIKENKGEENVVISTPQNDNNKTDQEKTGNEEKTSKDEDTNNNENASKDEKVNNNENAKNDGKTDNPENVSSDENTNNENITSSEETAQPVEKETTVSDENNDDTSINTAETTQIIERNDKKFGSEVKKVLKVGNIIKEIDSKSGVDVTIILGKDYNP